MFGKAVESLAINNPILRDAEKAVKAAKGIIGSELLVLRETVLETLPEGETVFVELDNGDSLKIDRRGKDQFDLESFRVKHPALAAEFTKRGVATYFTPNIRA